MTRVLRKPMTLTRVTANTTSGRPAAPTTATSTVYGATRHRLDDRQYDGGDVIQQEQLVYLPAETTIEPGDTLTFDGRTWTVVGIPFPAFSQRKRATHHLEVRVRVGVR